MGFGATGILIVENFTNEKINHNLKYYLEIWLYNLNYKNYSEFLFEVDLQLHSESKESDVITLANDFKESQIEKNRFILWELIILNDVLKYFEQVFEFYHIEKYSLRNFVTQFESEFERHNNHKIIEFIKSNLNNVSIYNNRDFHYFSVEIENFNEYQISYLHVLMYFDFIKIKDFLNSKFNHNYPIENYFKTNEASNNGTITETKIPMKQIALLHYYNGITITRENANTIAKKYNYTARNSGEGLYQDYLFFTSNANRLSSGETKRKLNNKIKLFENVIKLLTTENAKSKATAELNILKSKLIGFQ